MASTSWQISGNYMESCNCDYLCPCAPSNLSAEPTHGHCDAALVFNIDEGHFGDVNLNGLRFAVLLHAPGIMSDGNLTVGVITDDRATSEQQQALVAIASGQEGGPMAGMGPLISTFAGAEAKPIHFKGDGLSYSSSIPDVLDHAVNGVAGGNPDEPLYIDNSVHPVNTRLALAKATRSHLHAFGIDWDDTSGNNNGHFSSFSWQS